jgi:hypothetical protein
MMSETEQRFLSEIAGMSPANLAKYKIIVANKIVDRVLATLTISELKWLYVEIEKKEEVVHVA